jgi:ketosteroid isomerase-like protein
MYSIIAEQPILLTVIFGLLSFALAYSWVREGNKWLGIAAIVFFLLIGVAWLLAWTLETDEERIRLMIEDFAADVQANDHDAVYGAIHLDRPDILARAKQELPNYEFSRARVGGYNKIKLLPGTKPSEAVVDLIASVTVSSRGGMFKDQRVARKLLLYLRETDQGWKVIDYAHRAPVGGATDPYSSGGGEAWESLLGP